jgi:hypothetical protein
VLCDPDTRRSFSNDTGFLGTPGEDVPGEMMDSGRDDCLGVAWDPETGRLESTDSGFLGGSDVDALP